jgi:adenylate cyclase
MKRFIIFLLLLLPLFSVAQSDLKGITMINKDSLSKHYEFNLDCNWRYHKGDSSIYAFPGFNDSTWEIVKAAKRIDTGSLKNTNTSRQIEWYRLHISVDSDIAGKPLAIITDFVGAAEIWLDGEKITHYGTIKGKDSTEFFSSSRFPYAIVFSTGGEHLLAVRFMNYNPYTTIRTNYMIGFSMWIGNANTPYLNHYQTILTNAPLFLFLLSIFFALFIIHLLLFLYYRPIRSNLFFSIFCLSLSFMFLMIYLPFVSEDPYTRVVFTRWAWPIILAVSCFSFSGLNNELFGGKRLRFWAIAVMCFLAVILNFFNSDIATALFAMAGLTVLIEAIILTIAAMVKKRKGAMIVGTGILFFTVFMLATISYVLINKELTFQSGSIAGLLFALFAGCAILSIPLSMSVYLSWSFAAVNKDLTRQLQQVQLLSDKNLVQEQEKKRMLEGQKEKLEDEVAVRTAEVVSQKDEIEKQHRELKIEKKKSDDLLLNILPGEIAEELKETGHSVARYFNNVTVLFTDFVDFTKAGEQMTPQELVDELHTCFKAFDEIISKHHIEKIKTIGDAYLAVCGLPLPAAEHAVNVVNAALEINEFMADRKKHLKEKAFDIRLGVHSGSVVAGIVGVKKFAYDIWGDTVNTAARMEQSSEAGKINISQTTYDLVKDQFECNYRGAIEAKNKGALSMYFIEKRLD